MTTNSSGDSTGAACGCKLGRVTDRYRLVELDDELAAYWTGEAEERYSLRRLATYVNRELLRSAMDEAGMRYKDGEVENTHRLLTDDDVSSGTRIQTRKELERESVPVERVERDFVSHQTVYNHLTNCLDISMETPDDEERIDRSRDKLRALQNRTIAVTDDTIERLQRDGVLELGEYNVLVNVTVTCEDCGRQYTVRELFERGSCRCEGARVE